MLATWITLARLPLLGACLAILYLGSPPVRLVGVALLFVGLLLDTVDGLVARARSETSLMGSVLDIAADRTISVNKQVIAMTALPDFLRTTFEARKERTMFIIGDGSLRYADIIAVIDAAKGAGVDKVGIVTEGMRKGDSGN